MLKISPPDKCAQYKKAFAHDPTLFAKVELKQTFWSGQVKIAQALVDPGAQKIMVLSCHGAGKSNSLACFSLWHYYCYNPSYTILTAPSEKSVTHVLFAEIRRLVNNNHPDLAPMVPRLYGGPAHWIEGFTAKDGTAFQGRHKQNMLLGFDEAVGVASSFWSSAIGMLINPERKMIAAMNPTDKTSRAYQEYVRGGWHVIRLSALDHPNIVDWHEGNTPRIPGAVTGNWVNDRVKEWCKSVPAASKEAWDFEWPLNSGQWHRPDGEFEARVLGRWPRQGSRSVWSDAELELTCKEQVLSLAPRLVCGLDVARYGDDMSVLHGRIGNCSLIHERWGKSSVVETAHTAKMAMLNKLRELFSPAQAEIELKRALVVVDETGVGGGVADILAADGLQVDPVNFASEAVEAERYPNARSELWFNAQELAGLGRVDLSRIDTPSLDMLKIELIAPQWSQDAKGRRRVEAKDDTKKRVGRSPDNADAFNLCQYNRQGGELKPFFIAQPTRSYF
jgi:hypothetical protein